MRRFAINLILFALVQICLFTVLRDPGMSGQKKCIARTIEKHLRLEKTPPPRTILVGGSNVSFGFDSRLLEEGLGKPVINMGLAAGLGIEFMLNEVRSHISAGDTVLLSFEYDISLEDASYSWFASCSKCGPRASASFPFATKNRS